MDESVGIANQMLGEWWNIAMTGLFHSSDKDRAVKCLKPHTFLCGMEWWWSYKDESAVLEGVEEGSLLQQALNIQIGCAHARIPCKVTLTGDEVVVAITDCWSTKFAHPLGWCASHEFFIGGICQAINPEHSLSFTRRIADGHPACAPMARSPPTSPWTGRRRCDVVARPHFHR